MADISRIGFIGLGVMGEPICRNLAQKSGARVLACDIQAAPSLANQRQSIREEGPGRTLPVQSGSRRPSWVALSVMIVLGVIVLRSTLCLINLLILTGTTPFPELLRGLRRLGFPRVLVLNLSFLYRYLFVLTDEAMRMRQARECRRVGRASARAEIAILGSMLGTLLLRSFEHAERMYQAMLSRAYVGEFHVLAPRQFTWHDFVFLGGVAVTIGTVFRLSS